MKPAAPVTRTRTAASLFVLAVVFVLLVRTDALLRLPERALDIGVSGLEPIGTLQVRERLWTAAELEERVAEVVVRVPLVRVCRADALELPYRLLEER